MVLEAAGHDPDAVRKERRGERIAGKALVPPFVETECQHTRAVDCTARRISKCLSAHGAPRRRCANATPWATAWVSVSRSTSTHCSQPNSWNQSSRWEP